MLEPQVQVCEDCARHDVGSRPFQNCEPDCDDCAWAQENAAKPAGPTRDEALEVEVTQVVAALFVDPKGPYWTDPRCECWDESFDARNYRGPHQVVAHPPCESWSKPSILREHRYGMPRGIDGGCFASALQSLHRWGGVLEHPAESLAWTEYQLVRPVYGDWMPARDSRQRVYWVTECWQVDYGHRARKRTWLAYVGKNRPAPLFALKRDHVACVSGMTNRSKRPTANRNRVWGAEAKRSPEAFANALIELAHNCGGPGTQEKASEK